MAKTLRILTWHVHGNYLYYLTQVPHDFYIVTDDARSPGRAGRNGSLPWGDNVREAHVTQIRDMQFDAVLYQSRSAYEQERLELLTDAQQALPRLYLEHDPPQEHPTNTRHWFQDPDGLLVHVTPFNQLMWDNGVTPHRVIEHGVVPLAQARYSGELAQGIVVVNNLARRGRRLGLDVYQQVRDTVPLALVGMGARDLGGLGEIPNAELPAVMARYRFFFNPIRYTSLGLAVIEAMMAGLPIVGLATTELPTVIDDGRNGLIDTRIDRLVEGMQWLLADAQAARAMGERARETAEARFGIQRFIADWNEALRTATG
jgi:glycosyltransferase involved in cell wall biosynthesis